MANITGTDNNDTLKDTSGSDNIQGLGGDDTIILSKGGSDAVDGGTGTDTLVVDWSALTTSVRGSGSYFTNDADFTVNYGNIEKIDITTGRGADSFSTGAGDDTVSSGAGNDSFNTGKGKAIVDGGAGKDQWSADFSDLTKAVVLDIALAGPQTFVGGSETGVERLAFTTGSGNDVILTLTGAAGAGLADYVSAGAGDDTIRFGGGSDTAEGGDGTDTLIVDYGDATSYIRSGGGYFTDDLTRTINYAGIEQLNVTSGSGADQLVTAGGDDTISSGAGDDSFDTGLGHAQVNGGAGNDLWAADFTDMNQAMVLDLALAGKQSFAGGSEISVERLSFQTGSGADHILTLTGAAGAGLADYVSSGAGADVIRVGGGADTVVGGQGRDTLIVDYHDATTYIRAGGGYFTDDLTRTVNFAGIEQIDVTSGSGADSLVTGDGRDTVSAGAGDDSFDTVKGKAQVDGGAGNDLWGADFSDQKKAMILDLAQTGVQSFAGGSEVSVEHLLFKTGSGDDVILTLTGPAGAGLADNIATGAGSDTIRVGGGADVVDGGAGPGVDTLIVDYATATTYVRSLGGYFTDDLTRTVNYANIERLNVTTGSGNDTLYAGDGDDTIASGAGNDTFYTFKGMATIDGGAGDDTWGADFSDNPNAVVLDLSIGGSQVFAGGKVKGVEAVDFTLGATSDTVTTIIGTDGPGGSAHLYNDAIRGGGGGDIITVGGGSDTVDGGGGFDRLIIDYSGSAYSVRTGGSYATNDHGMTVNYANIEQVDLVLTHGADRALAGAGADTLDGGAGRDVLAGGAGADVFRFSAVGDSTVEAADRIRDFADGADRIDLSAMASDQAFTFIGSQAFHRVAGELRYEQVGHHVIVSGDVDGDGAADFAIKLDGVHQLSVESFVL